MLLSPSIFTVETTVHLYCLHGTEWKVTTVQQNHIPQTFQAVILSSNFSPPPSPPACHRAEYHELSGPMVKVILLISCIVQVSVDGNPLHHIKPCLVVWIGLISIHRICCFSAVNTMLTFSFALHQLLREIFGSLAAKCSTAFTNR